MKYNDVIKNQLIEYISTPAVLVNKDDVPYEYKKGGSINRLKRRRNNTDIPIQLYAFVLSENISKNQLREFASGLFLNYIETSNIYT